MAKANSVTQVFNQAGSFNLLQKQAALKAARSAFGQIKLLSDTTVNGSTALVTDADFSFQVTKGRTYFVHGHFLLSTGATPGIKFQLTAPASTTSATTFAGVATAQASTALVAPVTFTYATGLNTPIFNTAAAYNWIDINGIYIPEADDTVTVQFAQSVSNGSDSKILRGSCFIVTEIRNTGTAPSSV